MKTTEPKSTLATKPSTRAQRPAPVFGAETEAPFFSEATLSAGSPVITPAPPPPFFSSAAIQAKLTIGQPGDKYEQEADAMADRVVQRKCAACAAEEEGTAPKLQRKPIFESKVEEPVGKVQRKCATCVATEQISPLPVQRSGEGAASASPDLESRLNSTRSGGNPLPEGTRTHMESSFGTDFSGVRVHNDSRSVQMNQELGAQAFTHGSDIYFNAGKYQPEQKEGQRLLAHELTHTVQQLSVPRIQRAPGNPRSIKQVDLYLADGIAIITLHNGKKLRYPLNQSKTNLPQGTYKGEHKKGKRIDKVLDTTGTPSNAGDWRTGAHRIESDSTDLANIPDSSYDLLVHQEFQIPGGPGNKSGKGGQGGGQGKGSGSKKGAGSGSQNKTGNQPNDAKPGNREGKGDGSSSGLSPEDSALIRKYNDLIDQKGGSGRQMDSNEKLLKALKKLKEQGVSVDEMVDAMKIAEVNTKGFVQNAEDFAESYAGMSTSDREALRINQELSSSEMHEEELLSKNKKLPEEVTLNITASAEESQQATQQVEELNKGIKHLSNLHAAVTEKTILDKEKVDLSPIELAKLPLFSEMMMMEGFLAGAAQRSPEIGQTAKELTATIRELRSYIMEEIAWLVGELAAGSIISALLAPVSGGASLAVNSGRALLLIRRLNKLRAFIRKVESVYSTYRRVKGVIIKVISGIKKYPEFKRRYEQKLNQLKTLQRKLENNSLLVKGAPLEDQIDKVEGELIDEIQGMLDDPSGLGAILENFYIPEDADLREVLLNIPRGIEALRELNAYYIPGKSGDLEYAKTLALKATRAGILLYPLVGYLANLVLESLGNIVQGQSLTDRLLGTLSRASKRRRKLPGARKNRQRLRSVKRRKRTRPTPPKQKPKKPTQDPRADKKDKNLQWSQVSTRMQSLHNSSNCRGKEYTKGELLKEGRRIRSTFKAVAKAPKVEKVPNRGYWRLVIKRKRSIQSIEITVLMTARTRAKEGKRAINKKLKRMPAHQRSGRSANKAKISAAISPLRTHYCYRNLSIRYESRRQRGIYIKGSMKTTLQDIAFLADMEGLHFGTPGDPIPVYWYKEIGNYPKQIKLRMPNGKTQIFGRHATTKIDLLNKKTQAVIARVQVGFHPSYLITDGTPLHRKSTRRSGSKQDQYRRALIQHGYSMKGKDADHVRDLAFKGKDDFTNLYPLDEKRNRWAYTGGWYKRTSLEYRDRKNLDQSKVSTLYKMNNLHFKVIGFKTKPVKLGGRTKKWPSPNKP